MWITMGDYAGESGLELTTLFPRLVKDQNRHIHSKMASPTVVGDTINLTMTGC